MGGTGVATLVRSNVLCGPETAQHKPIGLGSSTLPHQPFSACPRGPRSLRRQWTTAKPAGDVGCNVLPFFLDLSLAFAPGMEFFDAVKSSVDSEVVFQATLQVPAHHALACRLNAYGTPFAAPDLQAAAHELRDEDLEFAACLATPPDLDEQLSVNFGRVMSLLEKNQGHGAGQIATRAAQARADAGSSAGSVQQQIRSTPGTSQQAPKVLVSVDEAESTAAQLQRQNSAKKQPKLLDGYGKRALQALLGLGYLLTVLHEKSLGGRMEFSAALTAASIISPTTSDGHIKRRVSNGFGVLAGLRQLMRECPSLSPMSTPRHSAGQRHAAAAAAAAAAFALERKNSSGSSRSGLTGDTLSPRKAPQTASSFEAAWERVVHPPLNSSGGGSSSINSRGGAARRASVSGHPGLQVQLSLLAPYRISSSSMDGSSTPGSTPCTPLANLLQQQQSYGAFGAAATSSAAGAGMAAPSPAPVRGSPLAKSSGGVLQAYWQQQQQQPQQKPKEQGLEQQQQEQEQDFLHKTHDLGRGSSMDAFLDDAIEQMRRQEPSLTDLATMADAMEESVFARAAATGASPADALADASPPCTPVRARPPLPPMAPQQQQQQQPLTPGTGVRSFYLSDQGPLTSPLGSAWQAASGGGKHPTPFGTPWVNIPAANAARESSSGGVSVSNAPGTPQRMLLPVMSMRLTCQPAWQYSSSDSKAGAAAGAADRSSSSSEAAGKVSDSRNGTATAQTGPLGKADATSASDATTAVQGPSLTLADFIAAAEAADETGSSQRRPAVQMHQPTKEELQQRLQQRQAAAGDAPECCDSALMGSHMSFSLPQGLWPTMSFSLVPVRLPPASPKSGFRNSGASCLA